MGARAPRPPVATPLYGNAGGPGGSDVGPLQHITVEPCYNKDLWTMKTTLLYQVSHYIRINKYIKNIKSWDPQNFLVIRGFCYIQPLFINVPLYYIYWGGRRIVSLS